MGNNKLSRGKRRQVLINLFKARVINRGKETKQLDRYLELFEVKDKMDELMKNHSQKDVSDEEFREKIKEIVALAPSMFCLLSRRLLLLQ
jgi:hypothetical protein